MTKGHLLGAAAPFVLTLAAVGPAQAQDAPTQQSKVDGAPTVSQEDPTSNAPGTAGAGDVVVTGSRIRRPNLDSPVPVTSSAAASSSRPARPRSVTC